MTAQLIHEFLNILALTYLFASEISLSVTNFKCYLILLRTSTYLSWYFQHSLEVQFTHLNSVRYLQGNGVSLNQVHVRYLLKIISGGIMMCKDHKMKVHPPRKNLKLQIELNILEFKKNLNLKIKLAYFLSNFLT